MNPVGDHTVVVNRIHLGSIRALLLGAESVLAGAGRTAGKWTMDDLMRFFEEVLKFFKMPMTVYGFTFSFWDIALWGCVAYIAIRIIRGLLDG